MLVCKVWLSRTIVLFLAFSLTLSHSKPLLQYHNCPLYAREWNRCWLRKLLRVQLWLVHGMLFDQAVHLLHLCAWRIHVFMIVYLSESIGSILPLLSLLCLYVLFLSLLILLDDGLVSECAIQVFLRLLVPLPFLPGHVDKLLLVRKHVFRVILLDFEEHFVLVHAMEGTKHQPLLVSIHEYVHA